MAKVVNRFRHLQLVTPTYEGRQAVRSDMQILSAVRDVTELVNTDAPLEEIQGGAEYLLEVIRSLRRPEP